MTIVLPPLSRVHHAHHLISYVYILFFNSYSFLQLALLLLIASFTIPRRFHSRQVLWSFNCLLPSFFVTVLGIQQSQSPPKLFKPIVVCASLYRLLWATESISLACFVSYIFFPIGSDYTNCYHYINFYMTDCLCRT